MAGLTEFLMARSVDDEQAEKRRLVEASALPAGVAAEKAEARLSGTMVWASIGMKYGARRLGIAAASAFPGLNGAWLRSLAAAYADHPDYREEWRP